MDELKPCPFCGSEKISLHVSGNWSQVECDECSSAGAVFGNESKKDAIKDAIKAWNTRV